MEGTSQFHYPHLLPAPSPVPTWASPHLQHGSDIQHRRGLKREKMHHALFIVLILCLTPSNAYQSFQVLKSVSEASMDAAAEVTYVFVPSPSTRAQPRYSRSSSCCAVDVQLGLPRETF